MGAQFLKGDKVWMTAELTRQGPRFGERRGVVSSDQRGEEFVNVRIEGNKAAGKFAARFWVRVHEYPKAKR